MAASVLRPPAAVFMRTIFSSMPRYARNRVVRDSRSFLPLSKSSVWLSKRAVMSAMSVAATRMTWRPVAVRSDRAFRICLLSSSSSSPRSVSAISKTVKEEISSFVAIENCTLFLSYFVASSQNEPELISSLTVLLSPERAMTRAAMISTRSSLNEIISTILRLPVSRRPREKPWVRNFSRSRLNSHSGRTASRMRTRWSSSAGRKMTLTARLVTTSSTAPSLPRNGRVAATAPDSQRRCQSITFRSMLSQTPRTQRLAILSLRTVHFFRQDAPAEEIVGNRLEDLVGHRSVRQELEPRSIVGARRLAQNPGDVHLQLGLLHLVVHEPAREAYGIRLARHQGVQGLPKGHVAVTAGAVADQRHVLVKGDLVPFPGAYRPRGSEHDLQPGQPRIDAALTGDERSGHRPDILVEQLQVSHPVRVNGANRIAEAGFDHGYSFTASGAAGTSTLAPALARTLPAGAAAGASGMETLARRLDKAPSMAVSLFCSSRMMVASDGAPSILARRCATL